MSPFVRDAAGNRRRFRGLGLRTPHFHDISEKKRRLWSFDPLFEQLRSNSVRLRIHLFVHPHHQTGEGNHDHSDDGHRQHRSVEYVILHRRSRKVRTPFVSPSAELLWLLYRIMNSCGREEHSNIRNNQMILLLLLWFLWYWKQPLSFS